MSEPLSRWEQIRLERAKIHRARCVIAANGALSELAELGIDAVVFGSLAKNPEKFHDKSDIDFCVLNSSEVFNSSGIEESSMECIVRAHTEKIAIDLCFFEELKPGVKASVKKEGVRHVK